MLNKRPTSTNKHSLFIALILNIGTALLSCSAIAEDIQPIRLGITAEFGMKNSHAAQSIERGILLAIDEINLAGGVLGRRLALEKRDDRGLPARAIDNLNELAENKDVVAIFCGRFSPVAIELAPIANRIGLTLLDPWAAADSITLHAAPNFVFRLSLTDTWAIEKLLDYAHSRGIKRVSMFLPNTAWGRSSDAAAEAYIGSNISHNHHWYNWGDTDFLPKIAMARSEGAQAILMVANEAEAALIVKQMSSLPIEQRLPIIAHWGIVGGDFAALAGEALSEVDLVVVQTIGFEGVRSPKKQKVASSYKRVFKEEVTTLRGQVGFAHAYDLTYLIAQSIKDAGKVDRVAIRDALEKVNKYEGLVRVYKHPFSANDHEALDRNQLYMARFGSNGNPIEIQGGPP